MVTKLVNMQFQDTSGFVTMLEGIVTLLT